MNKILDKDQDIHITIGNDIAKSEVLYYGQEGYIDSFTVNQERGRTLIEITFVVPNKL